MKPEKGRDFILLLEVNKMEDVINSLSARIKTALSKKRLSADNKLILEVLELVLIYMANDHPKTELMYSVFKPMAWVIITATTIIIGLIVTGKVNIIWVQ